jgi:ABC-type phosphate transport system permease subunit
MDGTGVSRANGETLSVDFVLSCSKQQPSNAKKTEVVFRSPLVDFSPTL